MDAMQAKLDDADRAMSNMNESDDLYNSILHLLLKLEAFEQPESLATLVQLEETLETSIAQASEKLMMELSEEEFEKPHPKRLLENSMVAKILMEQREKKVRESDAYQQTQAQLAKQAELSKWVKTIKDEKEEAERQKQV